MIQGLIDSQGRALVDAHGRWLATGGPGLRYRFLKDHWIDEVYYRAGDIVSGEDGLSLNWQPTADVDPLTPEAVDAFYLMGPSLPGLINSQWSGRVISPPLTYWYQISPDYWVLSGLGSNQTDYPPIRAFIGRVE